MWDQVLIWMYIKWCVDVCKESALLYQEKDAQSWHRRRSVICVYGQDKQLLWNLSCLMRLLMRNRNQNQMIIHKLKFKPRFTPNIKCNTWYALILSFSDKCRLSLWSRVSTLFSSGAVGFNGFGRRVLEDLNYCLSYNFCYYHLGPSRLVGLQ